jgi:hypothetical protein
MALMFRRSFQAAATKIGSGDPAPLRTRVDGWGRFIVGFARNFNGQLPGEASALEKA